MRSAERGRASKREGVRVWNKREKERERELGSIMEPQVARQLGSWLSVSKMGDFLTVNKSLKLGSRRFLRANRVAI